MTEVVVSAQIGESARQVYATLPRAMPVDWVPEKLTVQATDGAHGIGFNLLDCDGKILSVEIIMRHLENLRFAIWSAKETARLADEGVQWQEAQRIAADAEKSTSAPVFHRLAPRVKDASKYNLGDWKTVEVPGVILRDVEVPLRSDMNFLIDGKPHRVVAVTKEPPKYIGADYLDEDAQIKAFNRFTQYVGPPMAYYINHDGARYSYQTFAWVSDSPTKIVARVEALAAHIASTGAHTIIWRCKPEFNAEPDGKYSFFCRLHPLPYCQLVGSKPEGEPAPEA